jgi:hypothetical protein
VINYKVNTRSPLTPLQVHEFTQLAITSAPRHFTVSCSVAPNGQVFFCEIAPPNRIMPMPTKSSSPRTPACGDTLSPDKMLAARLKADLQEADGLKGDIMHVHVIHL